MENSRLIRLIYTFFVGVFLTLFVGVGINTFYTPPPSPEYPIELNTYGKEPTSEQIAAERDFNLKEKEYREIVKPYNRNVSMMTLAAALILLAISILTQKWIKLLADGIMLGGFLPCYIP